jgi:flagellar basal-body rod modification protein FlgD
MAINNPLSGIRTYDPTTANKPAEASPAGGTAAEQTQNFLKLLIAQIQNQDPMAPMDASTMTAQMSQLNMVSSMANMNTSMTAMLAQMQSVNFMNQAALIGHSPAVAGNGIAFDGKTK